MRGYLACRDKLAEILLINYPEVRNDVLLAHCFPAVRLFSDG